MMLSCVQLHPPTPVFFNTTPTYGVARVRAGGISVPATALRATPGTLYTYYFARDTDCTATQLYAEERTFTGNGASGHRSASGHRMHRHYYITYTEHTSWDTTPRSLSLSGWGTRLAVRMDGLLARVGHPQT